MALLVRVARRFLADTTVPSWISDAIDQGILETKAKTLWISVARMLGGHFDEGSAIAYWQTKSNSSGLNIPSEIVPQANDSEFEVGYHQTVEAWHAQSVRSGDLIEVLRSAIRQLDTPPEASGPLSRLERLLSSYKDHTSPCISFEQEFQFLLVLFRKHLRMLDRTDTRPWLHHLDQLSNRLDRLLGKAGA